MRKFLDYIIFIGIILLIYFYRVDITIYAVKLYNYYSGREIVLNQYSKNINYIGYQKTEDFIPDNKQELINIIYTLLDDGITDYMFYCRYDGCVDDLNDIADNGILQAINNYVHPYNSFKLFNYNVMMNVVNISIEWNYDSNEISSINAKLDYVLPAIINNNMSNYDKIKTFHDYIINNTKYDETDTEILSRDAHKAYNVIVKGTGVCSGYADSLAIFLYKEGINNFKISNDFHAWNVVILDNQIYNIDMTWDDPVASDGRDVLIHDYFMISTNQLHSLDTSGKHIFNSDLYLETK